MSKPEKSIEKIAFDRAKANIDQKPLYPYAPENDIRSGGLAIQYLLELNALREELKLQA